MKMNHPRRALKRAERRWKASEASEVTKVSEPKIQVRIKKVAMAGVLMSNWMIAFLLDLLFLFFLSVSGGGFSQLRLMNRDITARYTIKLKTSVMPAGAAKVAKNTGKELMKQLQRQK